MEGLVIITDQYINIINLDKARIKLKLTEVERLKVEINNGKDKMVTIKGLKADGARNRSLSILFVGAEISSNRNEDSDINGRRKRGKICH